MDDFYSEMLTLLRARFGTLNLRWHFPSDSGALQLGPEDASLCAVATLGRCQAAAIRGLTAMPASLKLDVYLHGELLNIHLIGRRVDINAWAGSASPNVYGMLGAADFAREVSFAKTVQLEMNSVVILLDRDSRIQGLNGPAEAYMGCTEKDVIGKPVGPLFLPRNEAQASRQNVLRFFSTGKTFSVERHVNTDKGVRLSHFRHRFVRSDHDPRQRLLVCIGFDLTHEVRAITRYGV